MPDLIVDDLALRYDQSDILRGVCERRVEKLTLGDGPGANRVAMTLKTQIYRRALGARFRQGRSERARLYSGAARGWIASRGVSVLGVVDLLVRQVGLRQ
jgi:hypothetical protein